MNKNNFLSTLDALLTNPTDKIAIPTSQIFASVPKNQAEFAFDQVLGEHPMVAKEDLLGPIGASGIGILTYLIDAGQRGYERGKRLKLERIIRSYTVARAQHCAHRPGKGLRPRDGGVACPGANHGGSV